MYVRPSTKRFFDFNEIWYLGRGRRVMHNGMQYDPIQGQGQGHEPLKDGKSAPLVGPGYPSSAFAPPLSIHFLIFCCLLLFPFFLFSFTLLILFYCPSDPFLPESSHSVSRHEVVGGDRTWV